jgi:hypothetical protein
LDGRFIRGEEIHEEGQEDGRKVGGGGSRLHNVLMIMRNRMFFFGNADFFKLIE